MDAAGQTYLDNPDLIPDADKERLRAALGERATATADEVIEFFLGLKEFDEWWRSIEFDTRDEIKANLVNRLGSPPAPRQGCSVMGDK